jgi:hypothetical protein
MKRIDIKYFKEIKEAYEYSSASTYGWAENRVKEIQDYLKAGNPIELSDGDELTVVSTINELIKWKQGKNLDVISFNISKDNLKLLEKLNININRFEVSRIEITKSSNKDGLFPEENISMSLFSPSNQSFYAGVKNVKYSDFEIPSKLNLSNLICRLAYINEISLLKNFTDTNGQLIIAFEFVDLSTNNKNIKYIVGRELDN